MGYCNKCKLTVQMINPIEIVEKDNSIIMEDIAQNVVRKLLNNVGELGIENIGGV